MFDPYAQMNPWFSGIYGTAQPYGFAPQQPFPMQFGLGQGWQSPFGQGGFAAQIPPQTWYGSPLGQPGVLSNPILQQVAYQLPQLIQQNPHLVQQAPQLQQVPQLLQQAAILAQQIPQVLQALCTAPHTQSGAVGAGPFLGSIGGLRPLGFGPTVFS